jgi:hypothetical protein
MTIKKERPPEEPVVLEWEDEEDEEDIAWMINEDKQTVLKLNNKKLKRKK